VIPLALRGGEGQEKGGNVERERVIKVGGK